ncbi:transporter substrate-binding domain-containing protein [Pseudodesulfovibrio indicus]|uniref:substrate-binding periplasmic protein n=1 Tax=Pseudodesulfovibrio indicus TaxID=1716143 RepID=UPI00292F06E0|nr:transporter substrate-binding domain-containing protein [Pseudodesulfovibrio indicus]
MRILLIGILTLLLCFPASAGQRLVFGYGGSSLSLGSLKVLEAAYGRMGIEITGKKLPAARSLALADKGELDGEVNRIPAIERDYPGLIRVDVPINSVEGVIVTNGRTLENATLETLRTMRVGIKIGNKYAELLTNGFPELTRMPDENKLMQLLLAGRLDALLVDRAWALTQVRDPDGDRLRINEPPLAVIPLYHYLHDRHAGLVPGITAELRAMRDSGEIDRILKEQRIR